MDPRLPGGGTGSPDPAHHRPVDHRFLKHHRHRHVDGQTYAAGAATASNIFARNLGSALGATALGAVLNHRLRHPTNGPAIDGDQLRLLLDDPASLGTGAVVIRQGLQDALHVTFWAVLAVAALTLVLSLLVPKVALSGGRREVPAE